MLVTQSPGSHHECTFTGNLHVWAEFYLQNIGWIPVDPTIGQDDNKDYFFGNLDNKRLVMSKGYNVNLEGKIAGAFQTGAFWWYSTGSGPEFNFRYTKNQCPVNISKE